MGKMICPKMWLYDFVKLTGALPVLVDLRVKKIYVGDKKNSSFYKGKYIISSNHMSYIDPVILSAVFWRRRVCFVAAKEVFGEGIWKKFFRKIGGIEIDKENPSLQTFNSVKTKIEEGHTVCIFPEGTVEKTKELGVFKSGIVMMATMAGCDIVPVYIAKRTNRLKRQIAVIGDKINIQDFYSGAFPSMQDIEKITSMLAEKEEELEKKYKEIYGD